MCFSSCIIFAVSYAVFFSGETESHSKATIATTGHQNYPPEKGGISQSYHLILCCPLLPSVFPSIRVFYHELALYIRWPKYWSFSFNTSPSNEYSGLISFRMDWLDLLAVQETLKSLLQHQSSKASVLWLSAFFIVQLLHPCSYWKYHSTD